MIRSLLPARNEIDEKILQFIIEIRKVLPQNGYELRETYRERRHGMIFSACYELAGSCSPDQPHAVAYLRVSSDMQSDNHSLTTQANQILALARENQVVVTRFYVDAGISGAESRRPAFNAAMRAATSGKFKAFYVYNLYRFCRGFTGLINNYYALLERGVALISVSTRGTDLSSRDGKLLVLLNGFTGEMYLDDLSESTTDNKFTRASEGYSNASMPPFGYCRGTCLECTDNNGAGYCPRFGSEPELWKELGADPRVFVPHPIDQYAVQIISELHISQQLADGDIACRISKPSPAEMERLNLDSRTLIRPLEDGSAIVVLDNGVFAFQHADGRLQFFRPQGRPGKPDPDGRFTKDTIRDMLQNPYYAGFVVYRQQKKVGGRRKQSHKRFKTPLSEMSSRQRANASLESDHGILFPGRHTPLISVEAYERSQRLRGARGNNPSNERLKRRLYPLGGILRCVHCGHPFRGNAGNGSVRYYEDGGRVRGASLCPIRSLRADKVERTVFAIVEQLRIPEKWDQDILAYLREGPEWEDMHRKRRSIQSRLRAAHEMLKQQIISVGEFREIERECTLALKSLDREVEAADQRYRALLRDFATLWAAATDEERKGLLTCIFSAIWVKDGEIVGYELRTPFKEALPELDSVASGGELDHLSDSLAQLPPS